MTRRPAAAYAAQVSPSVPELLRNTRTAEVLRACVQHYLETGEPAASAVVVREARLGVSPATVRVVLVQLSEAGLREKPHPSAGRVPSSTALKLYVHELMRPRRPSKRVREDIAQTLRSAGGPAEVVHAAIRQLAGRVALTVVGQGPKAAVGRIERLELVWIASDRVLVVAIMASGQVRQRLVELDASTEPAELVRAQNLFNEVYGGLDLYEIRQRLSDAIEAVQGRIEALRRRALYLAEQVLDEPPSEDLIVEGRTHFASRAECTEEVGLFLEALADSERLRALLDGLQTGSGARVVFGGETEIAGLQSCTVVGAPFHGPNGDPVGTLATVGPLRTDYIRVVPLVGYTAEVISGILHAAEAST